MGRVPSRSTPTQGVGVAGQKWRKVPSPFGAFVSKRVRRPESVTTDRRGNEQPLKDFIDTCKGETHDELRIQTVE